MPGAGGTVVQSLVNNQAACAQDGKLMEDSQIVGGTDFLRRANYFWFAMFFKLNDPGTIHKYLGQEEVEGTNYHKISVSYESEETGKEQNDAYILYLNPETMLVDQFFFSLPLKIARKLITIERRSEGFSDSARGKLLEGE